MGYAMSVTGSVGATEAARALVFISRTRHRGRDLAGSTNAPVSHHRHSLCSSFAKRQLACEILVCDSTVTIIQFIAANDSHYKNGQYTIDIHFADVQQILNFLMSDENLLM